jgi:hypothetical protein
MLLIFWFESRTLCKQGILGRTNRFLSFDATWTALQMTPQRILYFLGKVFNELLHKKLQENPQTHVSSNSSTVASDICRGNVFTEPLPSIKRMDTIYRAFAQQQ